MQDAVPLRILYVDDHPPDRQLVRGLLQARSGRFDVTEATTRDALEHLRRRDAFDLVLSEYRLDGCDGLEMIDAVRAADAMLPVVVITGAGSEEIAVEAMRRGAADYIIKRAPHIERLPVAIDGAIERFRLHHGLVQRLRDSEELHRVTLSSLSEAVFITDDDGCFTYICENVRVIFGYSRAEVAEKGNIAALFAGPPVPPGRFVGSDWIENVERVIVDKFGMRHVLLVNATRVTIGQGTVLYACRDITDRKRAEDALQVSEQRYRLLAEHATDLISRHRLDGRCLYASPAARSLLGYEPEELEGRGPGDLIHPDDRAAVERSYARFRKSHETVTVTYRIRHRDGRAIWFETTAKAVIDDASGGAYEVICVSRDVTARKEAEELEHRRQAELAHVSRLSSMGEMATGLAHELNQPLTTIAHYADACTEALRAGGELNREKLLKWTGKISEQADRAGGIIRRIKAFGRNAEPQRTTVDLPELIEESLALVVTDARMHGARFVTRLPRNLPSLRIDKVQIEQVLINLLRNALDAMVGLPPERRRVIITVEQRGEMLVTSITDYGAGIPADELEAVFEPFFTRKSAGTGMGLPISRSIVESHGGQLTVEANPNWGVTFRFSLPIDSGG